MKHSILFASMAACALLVASCNETTEAPTADKHASQRTQDLFARIMKQGDRGTLLAHQDDMAYGHDWYGHQGESDVKRMTGSLPAVVGWELADLCLDRPHNLDSVYFNDMRDHIRTIDRQGGMSTMSWHINNIVTGRNCWDVSDSTVVASVLPGGKNHEKFLTWLDSFAAFADSLRDDNGEPIPVVFRPYHENHGSWFWWGKNLCSPEEYKALWHMTFDYLTKNRNVHNLVYCYSPNDFTTADEYLARYPGDDYVDVLGFDIYQYGDNLDEAKQNYKHNLDVQARVCSAVAKEHGKPWTIAETGLESVTDSTWFTTALNDAITAYKPVYVLFWRNAFNRPSHFYVPYPGHPAEADFKKFAAQDNIWLLDDCAAHKE